MRRTPDPPPDEANDLFAQQTLDALFAKEYPEVSAAELVRKSKAAALDIVKNDADADDIGQQTVEALCLAILRPDFEFDKGPEQWCYGTARNYAHKKLRSKRTQNNHDEPLRHYYAAKTDVADPSVPTLRAEEVRMAAEAIDRLDSKVQKEELFGRLHGIQRPASAASRSEAFARAIQAIKDDLLL